MTLTARDERVIVSPDTDLSALLAHASVAFLSLGSDANQVIIPTSGSGLPNVWYRDSRCRGRYHREWDRERR